MHTEDKWQGCGEQKHKERRETYDGIRIAD